MLKEVQTEATTTKNENDGEKKSTISLYNFKKKKKTGRLMGQKFTNWYTPIYYILLLLSYTMW